MKINLKLQCEDVDLFEKIMDAAKILEGVFNSPQFKEKVLDFSYKNYTGALWWKKYFTVDGFYQSKMTNQQVYDKIMSGAEVLHPGADNEADITMVIDPRTNSRVIGYTYPGDKRQYLYINWARSMTAIEIASNMAHEWTHKLGFEHDYKATRLRPYSVPYGIGYIVEKLASEV
jgi:hypothetical protein